MRAQQRDRVCEIWPWRLGQYINTRWGSDGSPSTFLWFIFPPLSSPSSAPLLADVWPGLQEFGSDRLQACLVSKCTVTRGNNGHTDTHECTQERVYAHTQWKKERYTVEVDGVWICHWLVTLFSSQLNPSISISPPICAFCSSTK